MRQQRVDEQHGVATIKNLLHGDDQATSIHAIGQDAAVETEDDERHEFDQSPSAPTSRGECVSCLQLIRHRDVGRL